MGMERILRLIILLLNDGGGDVKLCVSCCEIEIVS
jgi:hypothetical protein